MKTIKHFKPEAIIFDKDGTLIDFNFMWGGWATYLADQISLLCGRQAHASLYSALGYDFQNKKVLANGMLASNTMENLYQTTIQVVQSLGFESEIAKNIVQEAWHIPDPVLLAKPFTNLYNLFGELKAKGIKIAIATADDRTPTQLFIQAFDIAQFIETMVCADDGIPSKPNAEMALEICKRINVSPKNIMVIGDTVSDLKMARTAGVGLAVGVLSGVSNAQELLPYADLLIESIEELPIYLEKAHASLLIQPNNTFNPDFGF